MACLLRTPTRDPNGAHEDIASEYRRVHRKFHESLAKGRVRDQRLEVLHKPGDF